MELKHARMRQPGSGHSLPPPLAEGLARFRHETSYSQVDQAGIRGLLEESFGKRLVPGYFLTLPKHIVIAGEFDAAAIIRDFSGLDYLDKFAVRPPCQGIGLAKKLWSEMSGQHDSLIWRSRTDNPAAAWYSRNSDSSIGMGRWTVFWYGIDAETALAAAGSIAMIPETLMR